MKSMSAPPFSRDPEGNDDGVSGGRGEAGPKLDDLAEAAARSKPNRNRTLSGLVYVLSGLSSSAVVEVVEGGEYGRPVCSGGGSGCAPTLKHLAAGLALLGVKVGGEPQATSAVRRSWARRHCRQDEK
jgi:hypothetical protein